MKNVIFILTLIGFNVSANTSALNISTNIDLNNLYVNSIQAVEFSPSILTLESRADKTKFEDISTILRIETDIPQEVMAISYISTLTKNLSTCVNYSGISNIQDDFVQLSFDGVNISVGESVLFSDFNSTDGENKYSEHNVVLSFKDFEEIETDGQADACDGEIEFNIEVDV